MHQRSEKEGTAWFLHVRVQIRLTLRVSRYNADGEQDQSHGTVILLTLLVGSRYPQYIAIKGAGIKAKTMTSLLIIPSVLVKVLFVFGHPLIVLRPQSFSFFCYDQDLCF